MKAKILLTCVAVTLCACGTNTNYAKVGMFQDRFDGMYYHYAETGKSFEINDNNTINTYVGYQEGGNSELISRHDSNVYWEVNYQLTF